MDGVIKTAPLEARLLDYVDDLKYRKDRYNKLGFNDTVVAIDLILKDLKAILID